MTMSSDSSADTNVWPLFPSERTWRPLRLAITLATAAAATWCYLVGESVGSYLGFIEGGLALTAGCMIGTLIMLLAAGPTCIRFGIDSIAASKPQFGSRGWMVPAAFQAISIAGWNALLIIFFAKSATQLLVALGVISAGAISSALMPAAILLACAVIFRVLRRGATGVSRVSNILVAHVFVGLWMLYLLVSHRWPELRAARPAQATADHMFNYTTGIELGIATGLGWWPYVGAMIRMAPNARAIVIPVLLGMGASVPLLSLIGLAGVLVLKSSNPAEWLRTVGGTTYAIISLAFVTAANFGTAIAGIYASAIGLRNFATLQRCRWSTLLFITIMPIAIIGVTIPDLFFDRFGSFLALIALVFAPVCGIQIADYFFLRRRKIDIRAIYDNRAGARYFFWGGVNPAAIVAILAGCSAYVALLNPLTYESSHLYRYVTASLPSAVIAALTYVIASRLVIATGRGGYP